MSENVTGNGGAAGDAPTPLGPHSDEIPAQPALRAPRLAFPNAQWPPVYAFGPVLFMLLGQMCAFGAMASLRSDAWMEAHKVLVLSLGSLAQSAGVAMGLFWLLLWKRPAARFLGLDRLPEAGRLRFYGLLFAATFMAAMMLAVLLQPLYRRLGLEVGVQESIRTMLEVKSTAAMAWLVFLCVVAVPAMEETIFRGFFFAPLANRMGAIPAALVCSTVFAALHGELGAIVPIFVLSLLLCFYYAHSGSLWLSIAGHSIFNALNVALLLIFREKVAF